MSLSRYPWQPRTAAARHDPISLSIGIAAISAAEAVTGIAIGFEAASFVGGAIITAGLVGANYLLTARPDGGGAADDAFGSSINSQEVRANTRQATPSRRVIYGTALVGGPLALEKVKPPYLYHLFLDAAHEIEGYQELRIAADSLAFSVLGDTLPAGVLTPIGKYNADGTISGTPDYPGNLQVSVRTGSATQTLDPLLAAAFLSLDPNFRQCGIATRALRYKYPGTTYNDFQAVWGSVQAPNSLALIKGRKLFDPRDPTQLMWSDPRDAAEVAAAEATWKWNNTAALVQSDYAVQPYGVRIKPSKIDYDKVADAANYDDELVGTVSGELIKRHTIDGVVVLNQSPNDVMKAMLTANRGFLVQRAGRVWPTSSRPLDPVLAISDKDLVGGLEFQGFKAKRDLINRLFSRFVSLEREYQQVDGPTLDRTDLQDTDGEILTSTFNAPFTLDYRRVERLQKGFMASNRLPKTMTVRVKLRTLRRATGDVIGGRIVFDSNLFSIANGDYRCLSVAFSDDYSQVELKLAQYDGDIERDWTPATDEKPFTIAPLNLS